VSELKRVRCPDIVRYLDCQRGLASGKVWLVTEHVQPLEAIKEQLSYAQLVLCMERSLHALHFLHVKCHLAHNNVCLAALFVHFVSLDDLQRSFASFKLGALDHCSDRPAAASGSISPFPEPPETAANNNNNNPDAKAPPLHSRDVWQMSFVISQLLESNSEAKASAISSITKAMRNPDPQQRPAPLDVLNFSLFKNDALLRICRFFATFRSVLQEDKSYFFEELDFLMAACNPRDVRETVMLVLFQEDVFMDAESFSFWMRLFGDFDQHRKVAKAQNVGLSTLKLDSGMSVHTFLEDIFPLFVHSLDSKHRGRLGILLSRFLGPILQAAEVAYAAEEGRAAFASRIVSVVTQCLNDSDAKLCCVGMLSCLVLARHWMERKDDVKLNTYVNPIFMKELKPLANDGDALVRARCVEVVAALLILFDRIDGMEAVRIICGALGDGAEAVRGAALLGLQQCVHLLPSTVCVSIVLPALVKTLLVREEPVRERVHQLIVTVSARVASGHDVKSWPEPQRLFPTPDKGTGKRKPIFLGSFVEFAGKGNNAQDGVSSDHGSEVKGKRGSDESDSDEDSPSGSGSKWNTSWGGKSKENVVADASRSLFDGLLVVNNASAAPTSAMEASKRGIDVSSNGSGESSKIAPKLTVKSDRAPKLKSGNTDAPTIGSAVPAQLMQSMSLARNSSPAAVEKKPLSIAPPSPLAVESTSASDEKEPIQFQVPSPRAGGTANGNSAPAIASSLQQSRNAVGAPAKPVAVAPATAPPPSVSPSPVPKSTSGNAPLARSTTAAPSSNNSSSAAGGHGLSLSGSGHLGNWNASVQCTNCHKEMPSISKFCKACGAMSKNFTTNSPPARAKKLGNEADLTTSSSSTTAKKDSPLKASSAADEPTLTKKASEEETKEVVFGFAPRFDDSDEDDESDDVPDQKQHMLDLVFTSSRMKSQIVAGGTVDPANAIPPTPNSPGPARGSIGFTAGESSTSSKSNKQTSSSSSQKNSHHLVVNDFQQSNAVPKKNLLEMEVATPPALDDDEAAGWGEFDLALPTEK
jgi:hypothetical protein